MISSAIVVLVVALLAMVAALGIVTPYRRRGIPALEPLADPLEDRRLALAIALRDLDAAHGSGALEEADYVRLRAETEGRMGKVLRALDERSRRPASDGQGDGKADGQAAGNGAAAGPRAGRRFPTRWVAVGLVAVMALSAALVPALLRSLHDRDSSAGELIGAGSLSYFEQRVKAHPHDVAARLDLAHRYLDAGMLPQAYDEYRSALLLDPNDADALAHIGVLLHLSGNSKAGLASERKALAVDPTYPDALFYEGLILLKGLNRPAQAVAPLDAYLKASPYGSEGPEARRLLAEARSQAAPH
jgi:tetratricopeptide (TPR) repeat protein